MRDTPEVAVNEAPEAVQNEAPEVAAEGLPEEPKQEQIPQPKAKKAKKRRSAPVRILMGLIAFILCIVMFAVSVAGVLILNVRTAVSRDGIHKIVNQLVSGKSAAGPVRPALAMGAGAYQQDYPAEEDMGGMLVDWVYDVLKESFGEEMTATREQVQTFVAESTVKDLVADKVAGLVEDFYAGTSQTTITKDEITQMIQENKELIESQFGVVINQEALDAVDTMLKESEILEPLEEQGLLGYIEQSMAGGENPDEEGGAQDSVDAEASLAEVKQVMEIVRTVTSYEAVAVLVGAFVLLMVLLFFVTGCSFPATLADTGVVLLLVGLIYGLPTAACLFAPDVVSGLLGQQTAGILNLIFGAVAGLNFTVLGLGFALIVAAIVVKIVLSVKAKKA
ncbi:MAG: hypothetical protein IJA45_03900 [Oscillospiraceae bacterium]|nr:hypothetical protein [Oscillospiraceae bacterium]